MKIVIQIGFRKAVGRKREGQLVNASVNEVSCSWNDGVNEGKWLTSPAKGALGSSWYLWSNDVGEGSIIQIDVKTSLAGLGADERRTFTTQYVVSEEFPVKEVYVPGVGEKKFPLIKGRIRELGSVSAEDERAMEAAKLLDEDNF